MTNLTDQYAYGYRYLVNVFLGSLQPANTSLGQQMAVSYRHVETSKANTDWVASLGLAAETQTFEIWTITLAGGYVPAINDVWTDKDGALWNVIKVDADLLVNSGGVPTRYFLFTQRAK
jgi:hypothetical protein